jgi:hypothetical protein
MRSIVAALSGILLVGIAGSQSATETFVIRRGVDTVAVEEITRTPNTLTGDLHLFEERTNVHYVLHLRPDGSTETAEVANDAPNFFTGTVLFGSSFPSPGQAGVAGRVVRAPGDALPVIGTSMGLIEYLVRLSSEGSRKTDAMRVVNIRNGLPGKITIKRLLPDSVVVDCDGCMRQGVTEELRVGLARDGGIDGAVRVEQHWTVAHR